MSKLFNFPTVFAQTKRSPALACGVVLFLALTTGLSAQTWLPLGSGMGGSGRIDVNALAVDGSGNLYAGGTFTTAGGTSALRVAKWDGSNWSALGSGIVRGTTAGTVTALAVDASGNLYAGGNFDTAGGNSAINIAKWDGSSWSALGSGTNGFVLALAVDASGNLYAGGQFTTPTLRVAKWDGSSWSALGSGMNSQVLALAVDASGNLYAGGQFSSPANRVAKWDGSNWSALGSGMPSSEVLALAFDGSGNLYAGGGFTSAGGISTNRVAKWDGSNWSALGSGMPSTVYALATDGSGNLYAGGQFLNAGGISANRVAKWDGSNWSALSSGINSSVWALAVDGSGGLYAGGGFNTAGGNPANRVAQFVPASQPPVAAAGSDQAICEGQSRQIGGSPTGSGGNNGPFTFSWSPTSGLDDPTAANPNASPSATTTYTVTVTEPATGLSATDDVTVTVNPNPVVAVNSPSVCESALPATMTASVSGGSGPFSYAWTVPTGASDPGNVGSFDATVAGQHDVTVTDVHGCAGSGSGTLTVNPSPAVTVNSPSVCENALPATMSASVSGGSGPFSYAWTVPTGADDPGNVASFDATVAGQYDVAVTDVHSCTGSGSGTLTVNPSPVANAGTDQSMAPGGSVQIGGGPTASGGTPPYTYSWSPAASLNDANFANPTASPASTTSYSVTVTDANGCTTMDDITVTVVDDALDHPFLYLANKKIMLDKMGQSEGEMHSNDEIDIKKGAATFVGNVTAVGKIDIAKDVTIVGDVTAGGELQLDPSVTITGTATEFANDASAESLPQLSYSAGGNDVKVEKNQTQPLVPGSYGKIEVEKDATLQLSSGVYFFEELILKKKVGLEIDLSTGPVTVNVVKKVDMNKDVTMSLTPLGESDSRYVTINSLEDMQIDQGSVLLGTFNAPQGKVHLKKDVNLRGSICSEEIDIDKDVVALHHDSQQALAKSNESEQSEVVEPLTHEAKIPQGFALMQNYPNPFNPSTTITFAVPEASEVTLSIYNLRGQPVQTLHSGSISAGRHSVAWDGTDFAGARVASGVYIYRLLAKDSSTGSRASFVATRKLVLMQ